MVISVVFCFLCKGFISENFNQEGKIPDESEFLHMCLKGDAMKDVLTFVILIGISSYSWELLDFSYLINFSIPLGVVYFSSMFEQGSLKFLWRQCVGLLQVNEVLLFLMLLVILSAPVKKWLMREFAIDCWLVIKFPSILWVEYLYLSGFCMLTIL